jgi:signal transduction histidine kinase/ligand-binding sensor domain-containing protein/CheY-like chemotaxis protein
MPRTGGGEIIEDQFALATSAEARYSFQMLPAGRQCRSGMASWLLSVLLIGAAAGPAVALQHFGEELPFTHFTTENETSPLSSASVQKVYQDRMGYIWFGFFSTGLTRYDGHNVVTYGVEDGLPDLTVREIIEDAEGRLWVGTESGLVVTERPLHSYPVGSRLTFVRKIGDRAIPHVRMRRGCIAADRFGTVWVATLSDGIYRYRITPAATDVERVSTATTPHGPNEAVQSIVIRPDGSLWVAVAPGGLIVVSPDGLDREYRPPGKHAPEGIVAALHEGQGRVLWAGGAHGEIYRAQGVRAEVFEKLESPLTERVTMLRETEDHELWVGSLGSGVLRLVGSDTSRPAVFHYRRVEGLLGETVWSILCDREQNLWIAQNGGVSRLRNNSAAFGWITGVSHSGSAPRLPDPTTFAVIPPEVDAAGQSLRAMLWVGTGSGLTALDSTGANRVISSATGLRASAVYATRFDAEGRLWTGTADGLDIVTAEGEVAPPAATEFRGRVDLFGHRAIISATGYRGQVYSITEVPLAQPAGAAAIPAMCAAGTTGVECYAGGTWYQFGPNAGVPTTATSVAIDASNRLWIGTSDSGIVRASTPFSLEALTAASTPSATEPARRIVTRMTFSTIWDVSSGARSESVRALLHVNGEIWAGTAAGLVIFDTQSGRQVDVIGRGTSLESEAVSGIAVSPLSGHAWVSDTHGIAEIDPADKKVIRRVDKHSGLLDEEAWGWVPLTVRSDGTIFFATPQGVCIYRPDADSGTPAMPLIRITAAELRKAGAGARELYVSYSALSFADEERLRYRTRLLGYEDAWSTETSEVRTRFTNLRAFLFPKVHTFEVIASNQEGVWTPDPARYTFEIAPPWWLTWSAIVLYVVALVFVIMALERFRTMRFKQRTRELEDLVAMRTAEIRSQARELETLDQIARAINREVSLEGVLRALIEEGRVLFPQAEKAVFLLCDTEGVICEVAAVSGYDPQLMIGMQFTLEEARRRYTEDTEEIEPGVYLIRGASPLRTPRAHEAVPVPLSMLVMELRVENRLEGYLIFDNFSDAQAFERSDVHKLRRFREHAVSAVAKARMLRELETKNREVLQASAAKSAFLANMSHELRTPMNAIIGFSEILADRLEGTIPARYHGFLRMILASGQHLLSIVNDILDLSKIEAGKMDIYPEVFDVASAIEGVALVMKGIASKRGVAVQIEVPPDLPPLEADSAKFKQILYNLMSNAVKFSPAESVVRVTATRVEHREIGPAISVAVADEGIGIAHEHQQIIFQAFRQLDATVRRQYGGTGLGLALVRKYADLHGGRVTLESEVGRGSTFTLIFPLAFQGQSRAVPTPDVEESGPRPRVLVVEDDVAWFETIRGYLSAAGYAATMAHDGEEALQLAREGGFSAITLDLVLPKTDGWEVLRQLKSEPRTHDIPVIVVSMSENRELGLALGADDYFVKPLDRQRFVRRMNELARV